jgi:hypothetical protein
VYDRPKPRRRLAAGLLVFLAVLIIAGVFHRPLLRAAGASLVIDDPLQPADVIVITADAQGGGILEAADLVRDGVARKVALFAPPLDAADHEFMRRGIPYEDGTTIGVRQLHALGVENVAKIETTVNGTEDEGVVLAKWCAQQRVRSVVVVSTPDHSRRLWRVLRRSLQGVTVAIRPAHFSTFEADHWWETRAGARIGIIELQKLLLDVLRHPMS